MPKRLDALDRMHVAAPCPADWDEMVGDDEVRFCAHCSKHVHDLSRITRNDVRKLIVASRGSLCVRYRRRPDGTVETAGRAEPLTQIKRRLSRIAAGAFTATLSLASNAAAQSARPAGEGRPAAIRPATLGRVQLKPETGWQTASLAGTVYDPQGAGIPGATVVLVNEATGLEHSVVSGGDGAYQFQAVEPGTYKLSVEAPNFTRFEREQFVLRPGLQKHVDATLNIGGITGLVVITAPSTPLVRAVWDDDVAELKYLLAEGVDVNMPDGGVEMTALGAAVSAGKLEFVRALIGAGADPNVKAGDDGRTALMNLDLDTTAEVVRAVIAAGAKLNLKDGAGNTALHAAAPLEKPELLRALIDAGAKVNVRNEDGRTALMLAAENLRVDNVKALLLAGADVSLRDKEGRTALKLAQYYPNNEGVVELLHAHGAYE